MLCRSLSRSFGHTTRSLCKLQSLYVCGCCRDHIILAVVVVVVVVVVDDVVVDDDVVVVDDDDKKKITKKITKKRASSREKNDCPSLTHGRTDCCRCAVSVTALSALCACS